MLKLLSASIAVFSVVTLFVSTLVAAGDAGGAAARPDGKPHRFSFGGPGNSQFLLDGKPFQILGGEMHPARIPQQYWRHRIRMARAMGLNAIPIYLFWNDHEQQPGQFDFKTERRDIDQFLRIAAEEGMWIVLRPGPYACGEWDLGGLPWWLLKTPDIKLRCSDPRFTGPVTRYFQELAKIVRPHMAENGGPILLIQLENEYGSYPRRDHDYMVFLRDLWIKQNVNGPFFTADGAAEHYLKGIVIPGVAVGLDTGTNEAHFDLARKINPGVPVMSSEVYPGWLRHWGEGNWKPTNVSKLLKFYMDTKKSFSLYVLHGGTNFGFTAGANNAGPAYQPDVTSYDYGSPVDEQGRATPAYKTYRELLASYLPAGVKLPVIPEPVPAMSIPPIKLERWCGLWDHLPQPVAAAEPACFESLNQNQGLMIYRTRIPAGPQRQLTFANLHDYGQVFIDGALVGVIDRRLKQNSISLPACTAEATLEILVEGMGHINFKIEMESDRKGIFGAVKLADAELKNWQMFPLPLTEQWIEDAAKSTEAASRPGGVFKGQFTLDTVADTFLDLSKYKKGFVWVNGHNLGRHWSIGPQQRLYCPAPWLKAGVNSITVVDLHVTDPQPIEGKPER